jgi:hypothetical protein
MSGRLNPREYDLGELRDAAREASRRGVDRGRSDERPELGTTHRTASDAEPAGDTEGPAGDGSVSAVEDPEAYLRLRHQRGRFSAGEPRENGRGEPTRSDGRNRPRDGPSSRGTRVDGSEIDLEFLSHRSEGDISRPYLEELPGSYSAQLEIFEWLDRLVSKAGHDGAISALEYYESVEWLSAESRDDLEAFVAGLDTVEVSGGSLGISDHRESLSYVARLAGRRRR